MQHLQKPPEQNMEMSHNAITSLRLQGFCSGRLRVRTVNVCVLVGMRVAMLGFVRAVSVCV